MKLAGRIPVEPIDEERLTNIERRVVAGAVDAAIRGGALRAPGRVAGRAVLALALAAAGIVGWMVHGGPVSGPVVAEPAAFRMQTSAQRSVLDIGDARIESDPETAFAVTRPGGGVLVALARGKVALEVGKRGDRPPLIVRAGDTEVVVVGTRFTVDYGDGDGEIAVRVTEGVVRVVRLQQETRVAAGQEWHTGEGLIAIAGGDAPAAGSAPAVAAAGLPGSSATTIAAVPAVLHDRNAAAPDVLHDRKAAVPGSAGAVAAPPGRAMTAPTRSAGGDPARTRVAAQSDPLVDLRSAIRAQQVEPALDLGEPDAANAIARYYDIAAHRSGDEASQAFYSIAAVRHLKLGRNADALQTLDAYVRRFPGGKEYRAALWLRVRILCLDKIDDRCRAAAYTYLHQAPDGPAAHVAELITQAE